jgi:sirohydrochlorin ferrochelatase
VTSGPQPRLVVAAHGSTDARFADVVEAVAGQIRAARSELDVAVGYLEHGPPSLADAVTPGCVLVPLLLSSGFHVRTDIPTQAPDVRVADAVGPDPALSVALAERLREAGWQRQTPLVLAAAGSSDERALDDVRRAATLLGEHLGVDVEVGFVSAGAPRLGDLNPAAIASYLVAPGAFHDAVRASGAHVVAEPIGAHPAFAEIVLRRYDAALVDQTPGRTAPA